MQVVEDFLKQTKDLIKTMPNTINIVKGTGATMVARHSVKPGQVFARKQPNGRMGHTYAHIGSNGRMYSVNTTSGELSSSDNYNDTNMVMLTGAFEYKVNRQPLPAVVRECRRSEVRSGEVFHVNGKDTLYAHLGRVENALEGFLSVPLARTQNHAITRNGDSHVSVVGTFSLEVSPVA